MDDTRQKLIDVAGQVFSEKGFEATTVREVCQLAGVNIAAIHYHFGDKERLYVEAVKHAHCQQGVVEFDWPPGCTPEQKLAGMIAHMVEMMLAGDAPSWQIELMMRELARPTAACQVLVEEFISPMFSQLLAIVSEFFAGEADRNVCSTGEADRNVCTTGTADRNVCPTGAADKNVCTTGTADKNVCSTGVPLIVRQRLAFSVVAQCLLYRYHRPIGRLLVGEETFQKMFDIAQTAQQITAFSLGGIRAAVAEHAATHSVEEVQA